MGSYKKKLSIVLLLFLLINFCVCSSANAGMDDISYTVDQPTLLKQQQEYLAAIFLNKVDTLMTDTQKEEIKTSFNSGEFYWLFTYVNINNSARINLYRISINIKYENLSSYLLDYEDGYFEDIYFIYPVSGYQVTPNEIGNIRLYSFNISTNTLNISYTAPNVFIPSALIFYQNEGLRSYCNGVLPSASPWAILTNAINENTDAVEDTTQAVNNLRNDFNEEESDSDYSYPSDNPTQDITESSIDSIFNLFYNKIDAWSDALMRIPIPFTGKYFDIPSNLTENILNSFPAGNVIGRLLGLIWYYLLGVYIIKDVQKYIDGLQTGEILTKSDTNIKTEML